MQIRTIQTQFDYHRISLSVSLSLSLLLQGYLSLPLTHTHYNSLLDSSILITVLSSESIMSACREISRPSGCLLLPFSSVIPHIRLLVQKLRQSLFPFTLFSFFFSFSFLLLSRFIATAVNSRRSQCNARKRSTFLHVVSRTHVFRASPSFIKSRFSHDRVLLFTRSRALGTYQKARLTHIFAHYRRVTPTIMVDDSLKLYATPINFFKINAIQIASMLRKVDPTNCTNCGRHRT